MLIRGESPLDFASIDDVVSAAFGGQAEAELIRNLRHVAGFDPSLSLVAIVGEQIAGHILFSPIQISSETHSTPALALAPLAVLPQFQGQGIGSALVLRGLAECRARRHRIVVVVGEAGYYSRFGFERASAYGVRAPFAVPDEAFMVMGLEDDSLVDVSGTVEYSSPFGDLE